MCDLLPFRVFGMTFLQQILHNNFPKLMKIEVLFL